MGFRSSAKFEIQLLPNPGLQPTVIPSDISFLRKSLGAGFAPIAIDVPQCFPANCLRGDKNRSHFAV
jgi:hypothetical protein